MNSCEGATLSKALAEHAAQTLQGLDDVLAWLCDNWLSDEETDSPALLYLSQASSQGVAILQNIDSSEVRRRILAYLFERVINYINCKISIGSIATNYKI